MKPTLTAPVLAHKDNGAQRLQIELKNDCAICVTFPICDGIVTPSVTLWQGDSQSEVLSRKGFKEWLDAALGRSPPGLHKGAERPSAEPV
jgi:hypothetical protein